jgi:hypothetical protein
MMSFHEVSWLSGDRGAASGSPRTIRLWQTGHCRKEVPGVADALLEIAGALNVEAEIHVRRHAGRPHAVPSLTDPNGPRPRHAKRTRALWPLAVLLAVPSRGHLKKLEGKTGLLEEVFGRAHAG